MAVLSLPRLFSLTETLLTLYADTSMSAVLLLYYLGLYLLYSHIATSRPPEKSRIQIITNSPPCAHSYLLFLFYVSPCHE